MAIKKKLIAVVAGIAVFAAVSASAATLGGIDTSVVGANSNDVAAPVDAGVTVAWSVGYDTTLNAYAVTGATLTANGGQTISADAEVLMTVLDVAGAPIMELSGTGATLGAPATPLAANDVYGVSLVINGGSVTAAVETN